MNKKDKAELQRLSQSLDDMIGEFKRAVEKHHETTLALIHFMPQATRKLVEVEMRLTLLEKIINDH